MNNLEEIYRQRHSQFLVPVAKKLELHLKDCLLSLHRIDRICTRAKSPARFMQKALKQVNQMPKYSDPLNQILDQIGARVVTFYTSDVEVIAKEINRYFHSIENKVLVPDGESEFGYVGQHFILLLPSDVLAGFNDDDNLPKFFELQIKTLFQHAWSEAEHDLGYKTTNQLTSLQKRKIAFTAAQAWGADNIFNDLYKELESDHAVNSQ
jgi:putative GTP pyrophosphokinase